jgi:hypothetical protein
MNNTLIDLLETSLIGKKITHTNKHSREVTLEVEAVKTKSHHVQVTPDTAQNDFWGESYDWETIQINFVDGSSIEVSLHTELKIVT